MHPLNTSQPDPLSFFRCLIRVTFQFMTDFEADPAFDISKKKNIVITTRHDSRFAGQSEAPFCKKLEETFSSSSVTSAELEVNERETTCEKIFSVRVFIPLSSLLSRVRLVVREKQTRVPLAAITPHSKPLLDCLQLKSDSSELVINCYFALCVIKVKACFRKTSYNLLLDVTNVKIHDVVCVCSLNTDGNGIRWMKREGNKSSCVCWCRCLWQTSLNHEPVET